jgi:cysteine-rich repeat protein
MMARGLPLVAVVMMTGCISIKVDPPDTLPMTDFSLSDILTDGFTQSSVPTDPSGDPSTITVTDTETTISPTDPTETMTDPTEPTDPTLPPGCGNGVVEGGEECDDGDDSNEDDCLTNCFLAFCGDGFVRAGVETCDDANSNPDDGCTNECVATGCGNGVVNEGEECDDGNQTNTDGCLNICVLATCGDNVVQAGVEACDDGNQSNTDTCVGACQSATCGDTFVQSGVEECDDGNDDPNDGCDECDAGDLPPECQGISVVDDATRNIDSSETIECDEGLPADGQWTRFTGGAGTTMPLSPPSTFSCGAHAPGWLNGALPTEADGIVDRQVCFNWDGNMCNWKISIQVRDCGPFTMFRLFPVPACALRYCSTD